MRKYGIVLLASVTITTPAAAGPREDAIAEIKVADKAFSDMAQEKGYPAAYQTFVVPDALMIRPGSNDPIAPQVEAKATTQWKPGTRLTWSVVGADASNAGDFGYTWGHLAFHTTGPEGQPIDAGGSYTIIWKRQTDKTWKAILDISTPGSRPSQK